MQSRGVTQIGTGHVRRTDGTQDDYVRLVERHWAPLVRYARSVLRSTDATEDVVQEAFVRLWSLRTPLPQDHAVGYLYRSVRNLALNERRAQRVRALWLAREARAVRVAAEPDDEEIADARVRQAVAALPRRRREVFELARFHDLSYQQIAQALGLSPQTVANHMSAAMRDLRHALRDLLDESPTESSRAD